MSWPRRPRPVWRERPAEEPGRPAAVRGKRYQKTFRPPPASSRQNALFGSIRFPQFRKIYQNRALRLRFSCFLLLLFGFAGSIFFFHTNDAAVNRADLHFGDVFLADGANVKRIDKLAVF